MNRSTVAIIASVLGAAAFIGVRDAASLTRAENRDTENVRFSVRDVSVAELISQLSSTLQKPVILDGSFPSARKVTVNFTGESDRLLEILSRTLDLEIRTGRHDSILMCPKFEQEEGTPQA